MNNETWKEIKNFENYEVSTLGRVRSPRCILKPQKHSGGYQIVTLYKNGEQHVKFVHSLVLSTFLIERPEGMQACHNNGNKTDNSLANLRWATPWQNQADRDFHGTSFFGKNRNLKRLSLEKVKLIRELLNEYNGNRTQVAKKLNMSRTTVADIANGRTWSQK